MQNYRKWIFIVCLCVGFNNHLVQSTQDPDAWEREDYFQHAQQNENNYQSEESKANSKCIQYNGNGPNAEAVALMYYKRLIAYLFNSEYFKHNDFTGEFTRTLIFTALPAQLEQLKNLNDPRDLDTIITEILTKTREPTKADYYSHFVKYDFTSSMGIFALICDIIKDMGQLLKASEVQFLLGAAGLLLIGWYCHRKYRVGIITMIVGAVVCLGYFHTYLECNRKLEVERLLEILALHEQSQEPRWYTPIVNFFTSSNQHALKAKMEYIKKSSQLNLNFCRPDHVFLMYANDLFLKQLTFLIDKSVETMEILRSSLGFPYNYLAGILLVCLIGYIVKLTIKYILSPRAWAGVLQQREYATQRGALPGTSTGTAHHEDRISGENLKMRLNAISCATSANQITISNTTATPALMQAPEQGSGVQEILVPLENGSADTGSESSMSEEVAKSKENSPQKHAGSESSMSEEVAKSKENSPQKQTDKSDNNNATEKQQNVSSDLFIFYLFIFIICYYFIEALLYS